MRHRFAITTKDSAASRVALGTRGRALAIALSAFVTLAGCSTDPAAELAAARASFEAGDLGAATIRVTRGLQASPMDPELHLMRGSIALGIGDLRQAQSSFERAIALNATEPAAANGLADALLQQGQSGPALAALDQVGDAQRDAEYWVLRAQALLRSGGSDDAANALARAIAAGGAPVRAAVVEAQLAELDRREADAAALLDRAVAADAGWYERGEALMARADHNIRSRQSAAAAQDLRQAAELYGDAGALSRGVRAQFALVQVLMTQGELDAAQQAAVRLSSLAPSPSAAAYATGAVAYRQGRYADAVTSLQLAANSAPEDTQLRTMLGAAHFGAGNLNQAEQHLLNVLGDVPGDVSATKLLARLRLQQQRPDDALAALRAVPEDQSDADIAMLRSMASLSSGDAQRAVEYGEQAVARDPDDQSLQLDLARMYLSVGRDAEAIAVLDKLSTGGEALNAEILRAFATLRAGDTEAGRAAAGELVERFPQEPRAFLAAAMLARSTGDDSAAEQRLRDAIRLDPGFLPARLALAAALASTERLAEAERELTQILDVAPNDTAALVALARLSLVRGDMANADALLTRAVIAAPTAMRARFELGEVKVRRNELDAALEVAEGLNREFPSAAEGPLLLGEIRAAQGRFGDAAAAFEAAFSRAPTWPLLARQVGVLRAGNNSAEAIRKLRSWMAQNPAETEARIVLADLLLAEGRGTEAIAEYDRVLSGTPVNVVALNNAAWLLREEDPPRALALARRAAELAPDHPAVLDTLGWLLVESGNPQEGLMQIQAAAERAPAAGDIQYHLAYALSKVSRNNEARSVLAALLASERPFSLRPEAEVLSRALQ